MYIEPKTSRAGVNRCRSKRSLTIAFDRHRHYHFFCFFRRFGRSVQAAEARQQGQDGSAGDGGACFHVARSASQPQRRGQPRGELHHQSQGALSCVRIYICVHVCSSVCLFVGIPGCWLYVFVFLCAVMHVRRSQSVYLPGYLSCLSVCWSV